MPPASPETPHPVASRVKRISIISVVAVLVIVVSWWALLGLVHIRTNVLWFRSVHASEVYSKILGSQVLLFVVFGGLMALAVAGTLVWLIRNRPVFQPDPFQQMVRAQFMRMERRARPWMVVVVAGLLGLRLGGRAAAQWQTLLLWRHAQPWGQVDPYFHRDISYYVATLPFQRTVLSLVSSILVTCVVVALIAAFFYGALKLRGPGRKVTPALKSQLSLLVGLWLLVKAVGIWVSRYSLTTSQRGLVTGMGYTDTHATLPGRTIVAVIALLAGVFVLANIWLRRMRYLVIGVSAAVVSALIFGMLWPALVYRFREVPSAASLDRSEIVNNQAATLSAFGLNSGVTTQEYGVSSPTTTTVSSVQRTAQVRLLDPNVVSPTFNVKQAFQSYYLFKSTLDIGNYPLASVNQDVAIAARELNLQGIPRNTWGNRHLVYTPGYGVVAAPTNQVDPKFGTPTFVNGGLPPHDQIPVSQPRIYFGQNSPNYSIVGEPAGSTKNVEFDHPNPGGSQRAATTTYNGGGGIPISSRMTRLLYAIQLHDPNIFFSAGVNSGSQLLTVRDPRTRVSQIAPWLILDGDVSPAIVGGRVDWVVDGYTSTPNYPDAQLTNLRQATSSALTTSGSNVQQPNISVNYLHNSVKAVVDAYTGQVSLYEWDQASRPDPLLKSWESAFPGLVQPQSAIPSDLLPALRYPQNLFDVQRTVLTKYHVTDPGDFYSGADFWKIPVDPTVAAANGLNTAASNGIKASQHSGSSSAYSQPMASVYMSLSPTGDTAATYSLSTPMVTLNGRNLAAFLSVDSTPGPDYGRFTLLQFPAASEFESPAQIQNDIESDNRIASALTLQRGGNSKVVLGNLLPIPVNGKVLYVEPVFTQAQGGSSFPILRHVIAVFGNGEPSFKPTLDAAIRQAIANDERNG
jgi:uncharacterized membrane protein (UPF0182 family)